MFDNSDMGVIRRHGQKFPRFAIIGVGQGVSLLRGFSTRVAVNFDVGCNADAFCFSHEGESKLEGFGREGVFVAKLDVDVFGAGVFLFFEEFAKFRGF